MKIGIPVIGLALIFVYFLFVLTDNNSVIKKEKSNIFKSDNTISIKVLREDYKDVESKDTIFRDSDGNVTYKGKIVITPEGLPLNRKTYNPESIIMKKLLLISEGKEPKEGCDDEDFYEYGDIGCYVE